MKYCALVVLLINFSFVEQHNKENGFFISAPNGQIEKKLNNKYHSFIFDETPHLLFNDLKDIKIVKTEYERLGFLFLFKKEAIEKLSQLTLLNKGKNLGVIVDGRLIAAPLISEQISSGSLSLLCGLSKKEMDVVEKQIKALMK
jgi:preprotein translocase subunit SecD